MLAERPKLRVGVILPALRMGGAERLVIEAARYCLDNDAPVSFHVIAFEGAGDAMSSALAAIGVPLTVLDAGWRFDPRLLARLRRVAAKNAFDILHSHLPRAGILTRMATRCGAWIPHVYSAHSLQDRYRSPVRQIDAISLRCNSVTIAVSDAVAESLRRASPNTGGQLRVIPNGVDVERTIAAAQPRVATRQALSFSEEDVVIAAVGNLRAEKGHELLVRATAASGLSQIRLMFAGRDDGIMGELKQIAQEVGVSDKVRFLGFRDDVASLLAAADIVCLPSYREGLPVTLLEAMALERAVIVSDVGGMPEVVRHDENGLIFPSGNIESLTSGLARLVHSADDRRRLGEAAGVRVRARFSLRSMVEAHLQIYQALRLPQ